MMRFGSILAAAIVLPYSLAFFPGIAGNPDKSGYLGQIDSVYDASINPPQTDGVVSYDPTAPLPVDKNAMPAPGFGPNAVQPAAAAASQAARQQH